MTKKATGNRQQATVRRRIVAALLFAFSILHYPFSIRAGEAPEDAELVKMQLQRIIAEQTMERLLQYKIVDEYERIRSNYHRLIDQIAVREKALKEKANEKK